MLAVLSVYVRFSRSFLRLSKQSRYTRYYKSEVRLTVSTQLPYYNIVQYSNYLPAPLLHYSTAVFYVLPTTSPPLVPLVVLLQYFIA